MNERDHKRFEILQKLLTISHTYNHIKSHILQQTPLRLTYNDRQRLGKDLKRAREKSGFTQTRIGKHLSLSSQIISGYENGKYIPSYQTLHTLCCKYEVSFNEMFLSLESLPNEYRSLVKKLESVDREFQQTFNLLFP